jgi:hypothetical protein
VTRGVLRVRGFVQVLESVGKDDDWVHAEVSMSTRARERRSRGNVSRRHVVIGVVAALMSRPQ